jgi:hypothetical protein
VTVETTLALTGVIVIAGSAVRTPKATTDAKRRSIVRATVGFTAYAFGLLILNEVNEKLATGFAFLFLTTALLFYTQPLYRSLGGFLSA